MLKSEFITDQVVMISPEGPLQKEDFERLSDVVDPVIEAKGRLNGLLIYAEAFPGWNDFAALVSHLKFVRNHQQHIARVAAVTDEGFLAVLPNIADHFVHAKVRHFDLGDKQAAIDWLTE